MSQDSGDKQLIEAARIADESTTTSAATPIAIDFLELSGELRNWIYDVLFHFDKPIAIQNEETESPRSKISGVNLLAVCHQVHAEANSRLYADNDFTVSGHSEKCNKWAHVPLVGRWLTNIGRQKSLVQRVSIDMSMPCEDTERSQQIDLLPILRHIRTLSSVNPFIAFLDGTEGVAGARVNPADFKAPVFNGLFIRLKNGETSQLNTWSRLGSSLSSFAAQVWGTRIFCELYTGYRIDFRQSRNGTFRRHDRPCPHPVNRLQYGPPSDFLLDFLVGKPKIFNFNINDGTVSPAIPPILYASMGFRISVSGRLNDSDFIATCVIPNKVECPSTFSRLRKWAECGWLKWPSWSERTPHGVPIIVLKIKAGPQNPTETIRIDASELILATKSMSGNTEVRVEYPGAASRTNATTTTIGYIRSQARRFLEIDPRLQLPGYLDATTFTLWMDGCGRVQTAKYKADSDWDFEASFTDV